MISEPFNFVYNTVTYALARILQTSKRTSYKDPSDTVVMHIEQSLSGGNTRKRHWCQVTVSKPHPDTSLPALTASLNFTIDRPNGSGVTGSPGFTVTEIESLVTNFKSWLTTTASTGMVAKLYGGES